MEYMTYIWLILGLLLIGAEFIIPGFVIIFFGIAALIMGGISFIFPGIALPWQILIWLGTSILTLGVFRRFFKKTFKGKVIEDKGEDEYVGKIATVTEPITKNREGRIHFQGTTWKAISYDDDLKAGDRVEILKKDNVTLIVSKVED